MTPYALTFREIEMANQDSSTLDVESKANVAGKTTANSPKFDAPQQRPTHRVWIGGQAMEMVLPLHYAGGDLGLNDRDDPWIEFADHAGKRYLTRSVEWLLLHIDLFAAGRDQEQPLACAAHYYGLNAFALMGREIAADEGRSWSAQRGAA